VACSLALAVFRAERERRPSGDARKKAAGRSIRARVQGGTTGTMDTRAPRQLAIRYPGHLAATGLAAALAEALFLQKYATGASQ
jgi:hypothetical protein